MDMKVENGIGVSDARFALLHMLGDRLVGRTARRAPPHVTLNTSLLANMLDWLKAIGATQVTISLGTAVWAKN